MASLTHVCMWSDNGWKRITAEQAARLHPGGTVSAHSGLFMCELCGQYVILTDGDIRIRYFKHSAYLYRYYGTTMEVSPLPQWQVEFYNYRSLACACLSTYGTLPPIEYFEDGALVHVHMNYLLPPRELEFLKLYSWPEICTSLPCNFRRKLSIEVFTAIKNVLSDEGYEFKGGTI